jgi:hypothetical protein
MLTDIFADRYLKRVLWMQYTEAESKLLTQCYRIIAEQVIPYRIDGKESAEAKVKWTSLHDRLSMELGIDELGPKYYSYQADVMGKPYTQTLTWSMDVICKDFVCAKYKGATSPDRFVKERLSFVELAFRLREEQLAVFNRQLPQQMAEAELREKLKSSAFNALKIPGSRVTGLKALNDSMNASFGQSVNELNERFRRAGTPLNYHNGFIQIATDGLVEVQVERPFWTAVGDPLWKNVDIDMKEALDRRDANERDPSFYAARALESAIKIISDKKGWTHGGEKGAHNYIENLGSAKNGGFIKDWEREALKDFFTAVRNPFGHGPGSAEMPELTPTQTNWAIETCMSWIKALIQRM